MTKKINKHKAKLNIVKGGNSMILNMKLWNKNRDGCNLYELQNTGCKTFLLAAPYDQRDCCLKERF